MEKKVGGLSSLISSTAPSATQAYAKTVPLGSQLSELAVADIMPNPRQPRRTFNKETLQNLSQSIREQGLLQPVIVKPSGDGKYELIAGERRWRAAKLAELERIPAVIRTVDSSQTLILSVIENLQREDLDPIEEASAYQKMVDELNITHEQVAAHVGKDRATVSNSMRLLDLPPAIQAKLVSRSLSPGHARVLLAVTDPQLQADLAEKASNRGMSVRDLERAVYGSPGGGEGAQAGQPTRESPAHLRDIEMRLAERLGVRVRLKELRRGGRLIIEFRSNAEFLRVLEVVGINTA